MRYAFYFISVSPIIWWILLIWYCFSFMFEVTWYHAEDLGWLCTEGTSQCMQSRESIYCYLYSFLEKAPVLLKIFFLLIILPLYHELPLWILFSLELLICHVIVICRVLHPVLVASLEKKLLVCLCIVFFSILRVDKDVAQFHIISYILWLWQCC